MGQLSINTINRIADRSQFQNPELKALLTTYAQKIAALTAAGVEVEDIAEELGLDAVAITTDLDGLAQLFGETAPNLDEAKKQKIKDYVNGLVDETSPELETTLENYFAAALEMEANYNETSAGVNAIVPVV